MQYKVLMQTLEQVALSPTDENKYLLKIVIETCQEALNQSQGLDNQSLNNLISFIAGENSKGSEKQQKRGQEIPEEMQTFKITL